MASRRAGAGKRRSAAEGRALVAQYRESGESVAAFCRRTGIGTQVVHYWLKRETAETHEGSAGFLVVEKSAVQAESRAMPTARARRERSSAVIVVVRDASASLLASTVQQLLSESGQ